MNKQPLLQVLAIPSFRNLWLSQVFSQITLNMFVFAVGLVVYEQTRSNTAVSLLFVMFGVPAVLFGIFSGSIVDHSNKRRLLVVISLIRILLIFALYFSVQNIYLLYAVVFIVSSVSQFFIPGLASLLPKVVPDKLLLSANSLFTLTFYMAIVSGFVIGGPVFQYVGMSNILLVTILLFSISTFFLLLLPYTNQPTQRLKISYLYAFFKKDIKETYPFIKSNKKVAHAVGLITLAQMMLGVFISLGPGFADRILTIHIADASLIILGPAAIGMIGGALVLGSFGQAIAKRKLIILAVVLSGLLLLSLTLLTKANIIFFNTLLRNNIFDFQTMLLILSIGIFFMLGIATSIIDVSCNVVIQEKTPDALRGKMYGLLGSLISGVAIVPVILSGILADWIGISPIFATLGIVLMLLGLYGAVKLN